MGSYSENAKVRKSKENAKVRKSKENAKVRKSKENAKVRQSKGKCQEPSKKAPASTLQVAVNLKQGCEKTAEEK